MDRGLWVTWCNLPEKACEYYLAWLHGEYIPTQLKRLGYLWKLRMLALVALWGAHAPTSINGAKLARSAGIVES